MALSANTVWEVRTTGSDTNGGGFVSSASGTDYSQQDAAQYSGTNLAATSATSAAPVITSATHNFVAADVGNIIQITAGTNWTQGFYQIVSCAANAATLDRACASVASPTSGTFAVGGSLLTIAKATNGPMSTGHIVWVKTGTYTVSSTIPVTSGQSLPNVVPAYVMGYNSTRGDTPTGSTRPTITSGSAIVLVTLKSAALHFSNFILDGANTATTGLTHDSSGGNADRGVFVVNCKATALATRGFETNGAVFVRCECTAMKTGSTSGFGASTNPAMRCVDCYSHANPCTGFSNEAQNGSLIFLVRCISESNTGASSDGFNLDSCLTNSIILNCVAYNNGRDGFRCPGSYHAYLMLNCISDSNTGYGLNESLNLLKTQRLDYGYNAFRNNGTAARNVISAGLGDVSLSADPFTAKGSGDFSLNVTAGGGLACRGVGYPGALPAGTTTSYIDIGAAQSYVPTDAEVATAVWAYEDRSLTA